MATPLKRSPCLGFGPFEVDASAGELRKSGVRVRLAGQPFQILLVLLAHPGEVVTREQLREEISGRIAYRFYCRHLLHELMDEIIGRSNGKSEIWVVGTHGENATRIAADDLTYFGGVRWSPDGKRIAYRKLRLATSTYADYTLESTDLKGGAPVVILSSRQSYFYAGYSVDFGVADDFCWSPDGRIICVLAEPSPKNRDRNLWEIAVDSNTGKARWKPTAHYESCRIPN